MKKRTVKKKIALLALCLALVLILAACGQSQSVAGQWQSVARSDRMKLLDVKEEVWAFSDDGAAKQYWDDELISEGTYTLEDSTLTIKFFTGDNLVFTLDENGNELLQNGIAIMVKLGGA
ncbi:hypothetical protein LJC56_02325 [Christensenellaceae bacterium OttesenSCG-928-K19]|nr:hypothetical protein [Christensenellaceae bacterium OttesenSCG-928-K19]